MKIEWDDLRVFLTAVRAGDYTTAARRLGVDRTTVGRRVTRLERTVQSSLWDQTAAGYRPTQAGRAVLEAAAAMELAMVNMVSELSLTDQESAGPVRLAGTIGVAELLLPHCAQYLKDHEGVSVELVGADDAIAAVQQRHADIGIAIAKAKPLDLAGTRIGDFDQALYLADKAASGRFVTWSRDVMLSNPQPWARLNAPQSGNNVLEVRSLGAMIKAVEAGLGSAWLWRPLSERNPDLTQLNAVLPTSAEASLWVVHRGDLPLEPAASAFAAGITEILKDFICGLNRK